VVQFLLLKFFLSRVMVRVRPSMKDIFHCIMNRNSFSQEMIWDPRIAIPNTG